MSTRLAAVCVQALIGKAKADPSIWVIDGDLADSYEVTHFENELPHQFIMAGIAEQNMVSMACGMASCGKRPWVFSFAAFLAYRAADQVRVSLSQTHMSVTLVGSHAGGCGGRNGKTHQAIGDLAVIGALPSIEIWTPCDPADTLYATSAILSRKGPSYLRTPRERCASLPGQPGLIRWLSPQTNLMLLCCGLSAHWAMEVQSYLNERGIHVGVLHVGRFAPVPDGLKIVVEKSHTWFVIEDHVRHGGLADAVARTVGRQPDAWFGWPAEWTGGSGTAHDLRVSCGIDTRTVSNIISHSLRCSPHAALTQT